MRSGNFLRKIPFNRQTDITTLYMYTNIEREGKISKYQMPNDQMPNYGVQTQYVSIRFTS